MMKTIEHLRARQNDFFAERPVVIACLGDSVTHGCFEVFLNERGKVDTACRADRAYPARLARALGEMYPFAQPCIVNAGLSGDSAANGRKRLSRDALFARPDLVLVNFGLNDAMCPDVESGLARYRASMGGIFDAVLESGAECLLVTPNFMCKYASRALADEALLSIAANAARVQNGGVLAAYAKAAKQEALARGVRAADAYAAWEALDAAGADTTKMLSNHINHPTEEAHEIFVREILRAMLSDHL